MLLFVKEKLHSVRTLAMVPFAMHLHIILLLIRISKNRHRNSWK
jgi:hypothetical protein